MGSGPHQGQPVFRAGQSLERARVALVLAHGRGATARDILTLTDALERPDCAYLAPQAAGNSWYPNSFLAPLASNEPALSSALQAIADTLALVEIVGIPPERTLLAGFSQGACLTLEYVARHARRYGGIAGFSGGLIGPAGTPRDYAGSLAGTPIFLGCSDMDPHIPATRVEDSAQVLRHLGAEVTVRLYPGMGHTVNEDERGWLRTLLDAL
jgi:predicted esterase